MHRLWMTLLICALMAAIAGTPAPVSAAGTVTVIVRPADDPEAVKKTIEAARRAGQDVVVRLEEAPAMAAPGEAPAAPPSWGATFRQGFARGWQGMAGIPDLARAAAEAWRSADNASGWNAGGLVLAVVAAGLAAAAALHRVGRVLLGTRVIPRSDTFLDRLGSSTLILLLDLAALAAFGAVGHVALDLLLPKADFVRATAGAALDALTTTSFYLIGGRFVLSPEEPRRRLLPLPRAEWNFAFLAAYGISGPIIIETLTLAHRIAPEATGVAGLFFVVGNAITVLKLWWFWRGRGDVAQVVLGNDPQPSLLRRLAAVGLPWLNIAVAIMVWVIGRVAAVSSDGARLATPSGMTQILVIVLPIFGAGIGRLTDEIAARFLADQARPMTRALLRIVRTLAAGAAWIASLVILANLWADHLVDGNSSIVAAALRTLTGAAAALIVGWAAWAFLGAYFDAYAPRRRSAMPGEDDETEAPVSGRLETVLPLLRGVAFGTVAAVTALVVLSRLGVEIGPFLAGFGVIGLAISFGSQALVRDIVSGIFFMADDAFRVGEYIDTGRLRGTVEKITLRSVQLRHQNGQIHTVPFGQLQSTTNFSRDWSTVKFTMRLDRDADIEKARKAAKRVGQRMQEDPELGPEFILPLKMQGVQEITDTAIVIRLKFTCKPTKPTWLQREALKRVYREFQEAGIPLASNAVTVKGGTPIESAAGASLASSPQPAAPPA